MTEIEKVKEEIKVLEKKLALLEELEKTKTPVEEAYKDWMGQYPPTGPSVDGIDDIRWRAFQMGYNAAKEEKVSECKPKPPEKLYDLIADWWDEIFMNGNPSGQNIESLVEQIEAWLPAPQSAAGSQNVYVECAVEGYNDCLNEIKSKLK